MGRLSLATAVALVLAASSAGSAQAGLLHFSSPSGNINCLLSSGGGTQPYADCLVKTSSWAHRAPKPRTCDLDWSATELSLSGGRVHVGACRGDIGPLCATGVDRCTTLAYGRSL